MKRIPSKLVSALHVTVILVSLSVAGHLWRTRFPAPSPGGWAVFGGLIVVLVGTGPIMRLLRGPRPLTRVELPAPWITKFVPKAGGLGIFITVILLAAILNLTLPMHPALATFWLQARNALPAEAWIMAVVIGAFLCAWLTFSVLRSLAASATPYRNLICGVCPACGYPLGVTVDSTSVRVPRCTECGWMLAVADAGVDAHELD